MNNDSSPCDVAAAIARSKYGRNDAVNRDIFKQEYKEANNKMGIDNIQPLEDTIDLQFNMSVFKHAYNTAGRDMPLLIEYAACMLSSLSHVRWTIDAERIISLDTSHYVLHADVTKCLTFFQSLLVAKDKLTTFLDVFIATLRAAQPFNRKSLESRVVLYDSDSQQSFSISSDALQQSIACINIELKSRGQFDEVINFHE